MSLLTDSVLQGGLIFFIFLAVFWYLTNKNLESKVSPKAKRLIQYGLFILIIILIILIFKNHSAEYIRQNS